MAQKTRRRADKGREREKESRDDCYILFHSVIGVVLSLSLLFDFIVIVIGFGQLYTFETIFAMMSNFGEITHTPSNCFVHIAHIHTANDKRN